MISIDIVIPFRNRSLARLSSLAQSFDSAHKTRLNYVLSNYGSTHPSEAELVLSREKKGVQVVSSSTQGLPWSRAHAINNGVRASDSEWLCILDIDMIVMDPVLDFLAENPDPAKVYFLESIWPQSARQTWKRGRRHRSYGVFQFIHRSWFDKLHGFDERMEFWGDEDNDWGGRLKQAGAEIVWLSSHDYRLVHTWHPWENNPIHRPKTAVWKSLQLQMQNLIQEYRNPSWGACLSITDRPILPLFDVGNTPAETFEIAPGEWMSTLPEISGRLKEGVLIEVNWGPRRLARKLVKWEGWKNLFARFAEATGLEIQPLVNHNLEGFLLSRDLFGRHLCDYYLKDDLSGAWLLGGTS